MSGRSGQRHRARTSAKAWLLSWTLASLVTTLAKVRPEMQLGEHMHVGSSPGVLKTVKKRTLCTGRYVRTARFQSENAAMSHVALTAFFAM